MDDSSDPFWLAKVDWKITDNHLLEFTAWSDRNDVERETFTDADTLTNHQGVSVGKSVLENGGDNYVGKYTGYLTDTFTVSALYGTGEYARSEIGAGPVYISFDIDGLDPAFAPGTGTPEIGGLTVMQGLEIIRGCRGLDIVGGDLVEVAPPYDPSGNTALTAANLLFEMLCVLPGVAYRD